MENIRLVIWDLDGTFWKGTLTEGGIEYQQSTHEVVVELARRGIMSSICSKNDFAEVMSILVEKGIWEYFIFPSINWNSKGQRIAAIIEDVQLRPATVLFIDDNPMNLAEASQAAPGIQVTDEKKIATLLDDLRLKGKEDIGLMRLKQYKLLEHRRRDQCEHGDNVDFLRSSEIQVSFDFDIDANIDRAIELVNRTNQLNFTKHRLPEELEAARLLLRRELGERNVQAALVRVRDKYGDYGFAGFYLLHVHTWRLIYFCFSCRTVGMGVERWLYQRLRRPSIAIVGEVVADLHAEEPRVDWVNSGAAGLQGGRQKQFRRAIVRGGCEMQAIAHYLSLETESLETEFAFTRAGLPIQIHHSVFLRASIEGISEAELAAARQLGYQRSDFESLASRDRFDFRVYSFWADGLNALYRDRETGIVLPFTLNGRNSGLDLRAADVDELEALPAAEEIRSKVESLRDRFEYLSGSPWLRDSDGSTLLERNLSTIFDSTTLPNMIFVLLGCERVYEADGSPQPVYHFIDLNRAVRVAAENRPHVKLISVEDFASSPSEIIDATHFDRRVYFRIYEHILQVAGARD